MIELLKAIGYFFINPFFYLLLIAVIWLGARRTKRERNHFQIRINDFTVEWKALFYPGIIIGLLLSIIFIVVGFVLPVGAIILFLVVATVLLFTFQIRLLSPAYILGVTIMLALFLPEYLAAEGMIGQLLDDIFQTPLYTYAVLLAILLFVEGVLVYSRGWKKTSPLLEKSPRGMQIGLHETKRVWLLPFFLVIPVANGFAAPFDFWPVVMLGEQMYSFFLVPFGVGFQQRVQSTLPKIAIKKMGKHIIWLSIAVCMLSIASYWWSLFALVAAIVAIVGREWLTYYQRITDTESTFFSMQKNGLLILDVLPLSPADKMGLEIGEIITKVNGTSVSSEQEFYLSLQKNRALCKLEVVDHQGEPRLVQRALYDGEHHNLGILFISDERELKRDIG